MKSITVKSFLAYAGIAAVIALVAWVVQWGVSKTDRQHPAYKSFLKQHDAYEDAKATAQIGVDQRHFEEALAGAYPIEKLPNADLQEVARDALTWAKAGAIVDKGEQDQRRYDAAGGLAWGLYDFYYGPQLKDRNWKAKELMRCGSDRHCVFAPEISVLGDPSRLLLLLNGDKAGVLANLPTEAVDPGPEPTYPKDGPTKVELPWTHDFEVWVICSIIFAGIFLGAGLIAFYDKEIKGSDPLLLPNFALGWVVMAAFAPGFMLMHGINASLRDARPWIARQRAKLFPGEFDAEFGELTARLETMRSREVSAGNTVILGDIDALIEKVRLSKSRRHIAELRKALDAADDYVTGLDEIEHDLEGRPSA